MSVQTETTETQRIFDQALEAIPGGVNSSTRALNPALIWRSALGSKLEDLEGRRYIDYHAAFGPIILGHNDPDVNRAVVEALQGPDLIGVGTTELEVHLAAKLKQHIPSAEKVLLCNSGSEATFNAVRLARAVTRRKKLIKFQGCYHGWHDYLCMNVISPTEKIGHYDFHSAGMLEEAAMQTLVLPFNRIDAVEDTLQQYRGEIAAIILEPIPHNIGCVTPVPNFLEGLRELTRIHGTVLIFDEVITGFRHGLGGYQKYAGVTPDLTTVAKSMANGYPAAALCGRADLMDRFQTNRGDVFFAGTYNGHPVGAAAALATIQKMEDGQVHERIFRLGGYFARELQAILDRAGILGQVAHFGSVVVPYFLQGAVETYTDLLNNNSAMDVRFRREMVDRGFFLLPMALKRNHISASHTQEDLDRTLEAAEMVFKAIARE
ncbi:MAG: glutamate-1-semialdehyde 2,1-aminomutase [Bryobacteraceae bacterium]